MYYVTIFKKLKPPPSLLITLFWLIGMAGFGQQNISGSIVDQAGQPVPFAHILALTAVDTSFVSGTTKDDQGIFLLSLANQSPFYDQ